MKKIQFLAITVMALCVFVTRVVNASTILVAVAHPDDESLINGTVHQLINEGHDVYVMYATSGKYGRDVRGIIVDDPELLGETRETEAISALAVLGLPEDHITFLRQDDISTNAERLFTPVYNVFNEVQPEIVITLGPEGIYGHKDHITISYLANYIFNLVSSCKVLFYFVISESQNNGYNISQEIFPVNDEAINLEIGVSDSLEVIVNAYKKHETQFSPETIDKYTSYINEWPVEQFIIGGIRRNINADINEAINTDISTVEYILNLTMTKP